jgi:hypothetical protein
MLEIPYAFSAMDVKKAVFFRCSFSRRIWTSLMADCFFGNFPLDWDNIEAWCLKSLHGNSLQACMGKLILGATVYSLWRQRNALLHHNSPCTEETILAGIKWEVRLRILARGQFKDLKENLLLVYKWNLHALLS